MPHRRTLALLVLAFALVLRLAVPSGWMPMTDAHGGFIIAPCPGDTGEPMVHAGHHSSSRKGGDKAQDNGDCSFAPFHAGVDIAATADLPQPIAKVDALPASPMQSPYLATGPPALPPPSTGPPALA